ncbi:FIST C-terminal domain-containing protein [Leptolyngbya sp. FACHB-711]|uniref:FIST signal transduction protein n=1 Tax=unclassified Leptolyngbya TaxID=2650499 RepID=UPI0016869563|nr:FIST C-terminal domain-containing protein [Leptolyngbya sp. FACHB-711]MBD1849014.1 FIST C-terminal domain-containing protein [Cyanobacteria bacterium FACHB-502]MBD2026092.1 FIST C-terminal domain-containing protein [Leptolyngbya sp. FACHB-711]
MMQSMKWASALSTRPSLEQAVHDVIEQATQQLQATADLAIVFISSAFASEYSRLMPLLQEHLNVPALIGCSGGGVIGVNPSGQIQEVEGDAALNLTLAHLPGVKVKAFHLSVEDLPDLDSPPDTWINLIGVPPQEQPQFLLLASPMASGVNELLQGLDFAYPGAVKVGGLASVTAFAGASGLFCNYRRHQEGIVGVALSGDIVLETIVAQGCRPIGQLHRIVEAERNIVLKVEAQMDDVEPLLLGGSRAGQPRAPLEVLQDLLQTLSEDDRELAQHSLYIGVAQSAFKQNPEQGDFLIRNLLGVDPRTGAIAVGDRVRPGQRIQFHLRDAKTSGDDLQLLLERYQMQTQRTQQPSPMGALMFSCVGRGEGLYNQPNFDSQLFSRYMQHIPLSGFFCNGEIGPVGGTTFLHGYTSVFGICRPSSRV